LQEIGVEFFEPSANVSPPDLHCAIPTQKSYVFKFPVQFIAIQMVNQQWNTFGDNMPFFVATMTAFLGENLGFEKLGANYPFQYFRIPIELS
jgi:hypothetical protein